MPGFTIHLAIGKRYMEKHKNEIFDTQDFIKGIIAPDLNENFTEIEKEKSKSHYGKWGKDLTITEIDKFLEDKKVNINLDYWKGYFMHLLTDYYFYNIDFKSEHEQIIKNNDNFYYDYDCLNKKLNEKYQTDIYKIKPIEEYMYIVNNKPKYLKSEKVESFIEKISSLNIENEVEIIKENGMGGLK